MKNISNVVSPPSFCFVRPSVRTISFVYIFSLVPQLCVLAMVGNFAALMVSGTAILSVLVAEILENYCRKRSTIRDCSAIVCGLLIGFFCPDTMPLPIVAFTSFFTVITARYVFGGNGSTWVHAAMATIAVMYITAPDYFPHMLVTPDLVESSGAVFIPGQTISVASYDATFTDFLNGSFLKILGIRIPVGYVTLFVDSASVIPALRFNLLTLVASVFLLAFAVIDWIVPAIFIVVYSALVYFGSMTLILGSYTVGDILFAVLSGGTLFTAFFILSDVTLQPATRPFKIVYAIIAGCVAFCLAGPGGSYAGMVFCVLVMNALNPLICQLESLLLSYRTERITKWRQYESK